MWITHMAESVGLPSYPDILASKWSERWKTGGETPSYSGVVTDCIRIAARSVYRHILIRRTIERRGARARAHRLMTRPSPRQQNHTIQHHSEITINGINQNSCTCLLSAYSPPPPRFTVFPSAHNSQRIERRCQYKSGTIHTHIAHTEHTFNCVYTNTSN